MNDKVLEISRYFLDSGKPVAAICHGPQILCACGGIEGKKMSSYPAQGSELKNAGAIYVKTEWDEAIVDGNIVTGPAWTANAAVLRKFVDLLGAKISFD